MTDQTVIEAPVEHKGRRGFLPIETNTFDRVFISVVIFVAVSLLWMRFIEPLFPFPTLWISTVLCVLLGILIVRKG
ncbi:MAG: DUF2160 family membrane protein [Caldilineaceae bacterium]|jgi:predicted small integral membrane protein